jgi:hypothetical protein
MSTQLLEHLRDRLIEYGAVKNTPEFCNSWLGRSEGYIRVLRYHNMGPSIETLVICANKLGYYADRLRGSADQGHKMWCERLDDLHDLCEREIEHLSKAKWRTADRMVA